LTVCSTPLGAGIIDTLALKALDDLRCASQRHHRNPRLSSIPLRFDDRVDLVLNAFIIGIIDTLVLNAFDDLQCLPNGAIAFIDSTEIR